jgi:erythromycin esterase
MYDTQQAWNNALADSMLTNEAQKVLPEFWNKSTEILNLMAYMDGQKKSKSPLILDGLDSQTTSIYSLKIIDELDKALRKRNSTTTNSPVYPTFQKGLREFINRDATGKGYTVASKDTVGLFLSFIANELQISSDLYTQRLAQTARSLQSLILTSSTIPYVMKSGFSFFNNYNNSRDRQMADNVLWLMNNVYKGKKVIIWAANTHIGRNLNTTLFIKPTMPGLSYGSYKTMGDYLYEVLGSKLYALGFTASQGSIRGQNGKIVELKPDESTIEYLLGKQKINFGWLDCNKNTFLHHTNTLTFGYQAVSTADKNLFDGLFYTRMMFLPKTDDQKK